MNESLSVLSESSVAPMSVEKIEQISSELVGSFSNDMWLPWVEKVNNVAAFEKVGQILRSRVAKHRALLASHPDNKMLQENDAFLAATQGFFLGWNEFSQSGEEEKDLQTLKADIVNVIGTVIGPSNTRRLAARNVHVFLMLWSCCPVVTHVLDLLKKYSSAQFPNRMRYWVFKLLSHATLPLLGGFSVTLIKSDVILSFLEMPNLASYGFDKMLLSQMAVAAVLGGRSVDQKVRALQLLEVFGPADVHRNLCLQQGLCLVSIAVQDFKKKGQDTNRESLYEFLQNRPGFEQNLWDTLIFGGGQETLDVAIAIANDGGVLADSLFRFLETRPHLGVLALHSLQCKRYNSAAAALTRQAEQEHNVLARKRTLASLGFLASKLGGDEHVADVEMRVCRAADAVHAEDSKVALTRKSVLQFCLEKLRSGEQLPFHVFAASGLELCGTENAAEVLEIIRLAYLKDDWNKIGYGSDMIQTAEWVASTTLGKLFAGVPPTEAQLKVALKNDAPEELIDLVFKALSHNQFINNSSVYNVTQYN